MKPSRAELMVENWNFKYPIGTTVILHKDGGVDVPTKTRSEAYVSFSGHAVCFFEGVSGYYMLDRATVVEDIPHSVNEHGDIALDTTAR